MSGAQGKAGYICGSVTVIAEVDPAALNKRFAQGWVTEKIEDLDTLVTRVKQAKERKETTAIGYICLLFTPFFHTLSTLSFSLLSRTHTHTYLPFHSSSHASAVLIILFSVVTLGIL